MQKKTNKTRQENKPKSMHSKVKWNFEKNYKKNTFCKEKIKQKQMKKK